MTSPAGRTIVSAVAATLLVASGCASPAEDPERGGRLPSPPAPCLEHRDP